MTLLSLVRLVIIWSVTFHEVKSTEPKVWSKAEGLAERYPYIVALLDKDKKFLCTGTIADEWTVLTTGSCLRTTPHSIAIGLAVINTEINRGNVILVDSVKQHEEFIFEIEDADPHHFRIYNDIGIVFLKHPIKRLLFVKAPINNAFASELQDVVLLTVGYVEENERDSVLLRSQPFRQSKCINLKWYYCICGVEYGIESGMPTFYFGLGAPALVQNEIAALTTSSYLFQIRKSPEAKYNIYTVVGAYLPWIEKAQAKIVERAFIESRGFLHKEMLTKHYYIFLLLYNF